MEFRILGPLEVRSGDEQLALKGARQRSLLAMLLLYANQVVSADRLITELWGEESRESATNTLQVNIGRLRKALQSAGDNEAAPVIATRSPGYVLEVRPDQLDLQRFERLTDEGRGAFDEGDPQRASDTLLEALSLWRGDALADFAYEPFAQSAIARLEELRLTALERRIDADLALGRHAELVGELEGLAAEHPLRERLRAQLMLALYRSGRQAEALDVYQKCRRTLLDELGLEPGETLRELERAVLRRDPELEYRPDDGAGEAQRSSEGIPAAEHTASERSILVAPWDASGIEPLVALVEPLARRPDREVIMARLLRDGGELAEASASLRRQKETLSSRGVVARSAVFTSAAPAEDIVRLASEQDVALLLVDASVSMLAEGALEGDLGRVVDKALCDVGILVHGRRRVELGPGARVLVPFGGAEHDWAAIELASWITKASAGVMTLLGTTGDPEGGERDASRLLAHASLAVQRALSVDAEPLLVPPGEEPVIAAANDAALLVFGLSTRWRQEGLGATRLSVVRGARPPSLLVRKGLRPSGLAPRESLTRFTWALSGAA